MKRAFCLLFLIPLIFCSGCNSTGYTQTPETEAALETYYAAVKESVAQAGGVIDVSIHMKDTVVTKTETDERYKYTYTVKDNKESFDYRCYDAKDKLTAHYFTNSNGEVMNQLTGEKADNFATYQNHLKNPISTLQLFRMDANFKVQKSTISSIKMEQNKEDTVVTVTFHGDKLTGLSIKNEGGLIRTITSHKRIYTIRNGKIAKIEITDRENAQYKNETGNIDTDTIVEINYYGTSSDI